MQSFNLLPWRDQQQKKRQRSALAALACGALAALAVIAGSDLYLRKQLHLAQAQLADARAAIAAQEQVAVNRAELEARNAQLSSLLEEILRIRAGNRVARNWLRALPAVMPPGPQLARLALSGESWQLSGSVAEMEQAALLLHHLRDMPAVRDARIEQLRSDSNRARRFMLIGKLKE